MLFNLTDYWEDSPHENSSQITVLELVFSKNFHRRDHQNLLIVQLMKILRSKIGSIKAKQPPFGGMLVFTHPAIGNLSHLTKLGGLSIL